MKDHPGLKYCIVYIYCIWIWRKPIIVKLCSWTPGTGWMPTGPQNLGIHGNNLKILNNVLLLTVPQSMQGWRNLSTAISWQRRDEGVAATGSWQDQVRVWNEILLSSMKRTRVHQSVVCFCMYCLKLSSLQLQAISIFWPLQAFVGGRVCFGVLFEAQNKIF